MKLDLLPGEEKIFKRLDSPKKIQDFLNSIPKNFEKTGETCYSPRLVLRENMAHCVEGAFLAASILWYHGEKPLIFDLRSNSEDFDHVVALFKKNGHWGAISKTNYAVLRYREPIYKNARELALSYFHEYFLDNGDKTLREFSVPIDLSKFGTEWITADRNLWDIYFEIDKYRHTPILSRSMISALRKADKIEIEAGKLREWKK
ncbi:MAG: hypothetical protein UW43_C0004G0036 [Candidatus Yanofskybacteria bacterium GW2011_GWA1_44_21]|uniref:Transglutaminase-like domain-containing protein n=2 Tax=Candidatus Yanofskyibacteriota TaxID=1752733 RepID=A0A1F8GZI7_9BACT|nr:MAG: hypothetical protein UW14_C0005G0022 [Candidatus Yanofskybacteria bacterium GW2011_GWA2_44_10]KKT50604.1 MAG: hypothetical protein UW43_C0004G0036 [Candidatus Yanofskybacteria bacterium GW2011_GWA1_44_21]KKT90118.1 MAG: hypothetical protein UW90_C0006G0018 [Candidatus Yanofskybacteria bacterium GW2011_GWB1_45_11]OGN02783.1 MAG: hypothetical protein A2657_01410 [Candidatus Yanofskybacteria bacterium RIFCSPHIGHO2_01_FULL_44_110b]OGN14656.1 MAG: hypothetical protein A3C01_03155 [Candidatus